jgi:hypothetical protein
VTLFGIWVSTDVSSQEEGILDEVNLKSSRTSCKKRNGSQASVAHAYNPDYSKGRNQEDFNLKPAQANSS